MRDELQLLVDRIADRVGRPALIEDRRQRVVCYSAQVEPLDEVRRSSILRRSTTPEVIAFFARFDITRARRPVHTPAEPALGLLPRVCVPVWHSDLLLGFVWFVDSPALSEPEVARAVELSGDLALALYRVNLLGELTARREADAVRGLLADDPEVRARAATMIVGEDMLVSDGPAVALVTAGSRGAFARDARSAVSSAALEQALVATRRYCGHRHAVHLVRPEHGLLLLRTGSVPAADAAEHLAGQVGGAVGVGDPSPSLADVHESVAQAAQALRFSPARVAMWSQLGVYRVLAAADLSAEQLHPGMRRLSAAPELAATLETYLDLAGDAAATAAQLRIHRTTLYYRLSRAAELTGADLRDGLQRLQLHLALKATHLTH
jgi:hypothetical protein